jgi:D-alanine-D-alanine ligase
MTCPRVPHIPKRRSVYEALDKSKFEIILVGIDRSGRWRVGDLAQIQAAASLLPELESGSAETALAIVPGGGGEIASGRTFPQLDVVIPLLHGTYGEDGTVQGLLKLAGIPFVGAGVLGSAIGMDKDVAKRLMRDGGVPVARFVTLSASAAAATAFETLADQLGVPFFVKPANAGSSVGINKVRTTAEWAAARAEASRYDHKLLIEEFIEGREIEVAVLGNSDPQASVPGEITPRHEFYSYEAKYLDENGAALRIPAELPPERAIQIRQLAVKPFRILECAGMARVDFFVCDDGRIYVNEINTIPGFTKISMYPKLWEATGLPYCELLEKLMRLAIERHNAEQRIETTFRPALPAPPAP